MRKIIAILALIGLTATANAASVWKVSNGHSELYLGGTLHLLSQSDYPLPPEYDEAYAAADALVFETDIATVESPEFVSQMMSKLMYSDGRTLADDLNPDTLLQLKNFVGRYGLTFAQLQMFKPTIVSLTLNVMELQRLGLREKGVDSHFFMKGRQGNKRIAWLETPLEQIDFIVGMGAGKEDQLVKYTLRDLENVPTMLKQLRADWLAGDMSALNEHVLIDFKQNFPDIYTNLIVLRNNNWMPKIVQYMNTPEVEFVLVGATHMAGDDGLLAQLKEAGYTVTKL